MGIFKKQEVDRIKNEFEAVDIIPSRESVRKESMQAQGSNKITDGEDDVGVTLHESLKE